MRSHSRRRAAGISIGVPLLALCAFLFRDAIADFAASDRFPSCRFFQLTGCLCPACGNTWVLCWNCSMVICCVRWGTTP